MALLDRPEKHTGGSRGGFQLQQYRLGHVVWLVNLERLAFANRIRGVTNRHRIKHVSRLAGKSIGPICPSEGFANTLGRTRSQGEYKCLMDRKYKAGSGFHNSLRFSCQHGIIPQHRTPRSTYVRQAKS